MGRQNERTGPLGCGHSRGLFLPLGRGNLGTFPRLTERACSPTVTAKFNRVLEALKRHVITPDMVLSRAFLGVFGKCQDPDLNWGHGDFQSPALPTELSRRVAEATQES